MFLSQTMVLASGGQDGAICLWDVLTGSRVSHVYGHRGDVTSLVCTTSCVISSGLDDLICIWDRSTGIKLYSIQQVPTRFYRSVVCAVACFSLAQQGTTGSEVEFFSVFQIGDNNFIFCRLSCSKNTAVQTRTLRI